MICTGSFQVPKSDLLLHMLALEQVAAQPATFIELSNQSGTGKAEVWLCGSVNSTLRL